MAPKPKLSAQEKEEIRRLYKTGKHSYEKLAAMFNVNKWTIIRAVKDPEGKKTKEINTRARKNNLEKYNKTAMENNRTFRFSINRNVDPVMIAFLDAKENLRQYLLNLIKTDMEKHPEDVAEALRIQEQKQKEIKLHD